MILLGTIVPIRYSWPIGGQLIPVHVSLMPVAPEGSVSDYDRTHLALYAALLDAEAAGVGWRNATATLMRLDPDHEGAKRCWHSHLERARWITGCGLAEAVEVFGKREI